MGEPIQSYENLNVYQRAFELSIDIHRASLSFPKIEQYALCDQLRRSSKSICANIAEGFYRQRASNADYMRFLIMALGSAGETRSWISYCERLGYIDKDKAAEWCAEYDIVAKMLHALYSSRSKL